jgi:anti-sigma-K factor RskA
MPDEPTFEADLVDVEAMLRQLDADDLVLDAPPDDVWAAIVEELSLDDDRREAASRGVDAVVTAPFGRRRTWMLPLAAAAAVILVVAVAVAVSRSDSTTTLAHADLEFQPGFDEAGANAAASADLVEDDGSDVIEIDDASLPFDLDEDVALELWLIEADDDGNVVDLVSLGDIAADGTRAFSVPAGYDPTVYSVVDISIEPRDGDASHSGRSILRGALGSI